MTEFIPFNDLKKNYMSIKSEIDKSIQNVIDNITYSNKKLKVLKVIFFLFKCKILLVFLQVLLQLSWH